MKTLEKLTDKELKLLAEEMVKLQETTPFKVDLLENTRRELSAEFGIKFSIKQTEYYILSEILNRFIKLVK
jgi:hypothetical protein